MREMTTKQIRGLYNLQTEAPVALPFHGGIATYDNIPVSRKRSPDCITETASLPVPQKHKLSSQPLILDQELLLHLHNQQSEIHRCIAQHSEKVRMELQEQNVKQSRMLINAIREAMAKKLKEKDEEIERVWKLNCVLQETVKSVCMENQFLRELAQTSEATANNLRNNLEQLLAHVSDEHRYHTAVESSCQSSNNRREEEEVSGGNGNRNENGNDGVWGKRKCRLCGEKESIVMLLPCRHLCVCTMCGSTVHHCPVCHSRINASVHVNYS